MFHLTPQERVAIASLLTVFTVGILVSIGLKKDAHLTQWINITHQSPKHYPLDLNKATTEQLDKLSGIGLKTAQRIVDYRKAHGSFRSVDELRHVRGIPKKKFDKVATLVRVGVLHE